EDWHKRSVIADISGGTELRPEKGAAELFDLGVGIAETRGQLQPTGGLGLKRDLASSNASALHVVGIRADSSGRDLNQTELLVLVFRIEQSHIQHEATVEQSGFAADLEGPGGFRRKRTGDVRADAAVEASGTKALGVGPVDVRLRSEL